MYIKDKLFIGFNKVVNVCVVFFLCGSWKNVKRGDRY